MEKKSWRDIKRGEKGKLLERKVKASEILQTLGEWIHRESGRHKKPARIGRRRTDP